MPTHQSACCVHHSQSAASLGLGVGAEGEQRPAGLLEALRLEVREAQHRLVRLRGSDCLEGVASAQDVLACFRAISIVLPVF